MKHIILTCCFLFALNSSYSQFQKTEKGLTIIVSDGTDKGRNSEITLGNDIPTSYDQISTGSNSATSKSPKNSIKFSDPIRELGMMDCIQAGAFLDRPEYGKIGFMLIFSINDSIGGKQATLIKDGKTYKGVYRIIKQKTSKEEPIPKGMTNYKIEGTFILLGIS